MLCVKVTTNSIIKAQALTVGFSFFGFFVT